MKTLKPLGKRVLIKQTIIKKSGMIHIPEQARAELDSLTAEIVALGDDVTMFDKSHIGQDVHFGRYAAYLVIDLRTDDTDYLIINDYDILGLFS